ncbi:MAG TPA: OmpA family protein [Verrucomicrobiae bacterium]|nr:OmpA family protein [Verrucomicrobiae bacterium]
MNTAKILSRTGIASALLLVVACAPSHLRNEEAANARARLTQLQNDPQLATMAPVALKDAETAVVLAELSTDDALVRRHRVVLAERRVDIARAQAQRRYDEDQLKVLSQQRETARLDSRTREADTARRDAAIARGDAEDARDDAYHAERSASSARSDAEIARSDAEVARQAVEFARLDTMAARQDTAAVQRQLEELNATKTDRGMVVTLGDVMFAPGGSTLRGSTPANLDRLATFLKENPERNVQIEGHTDALGSNDANLVLSQRRAEAVSKYLERAGVASGRLMAAGKGEEMPVASNDTVTGRQQNRRVEVIISNNEVR